MENERWNYDRLHFYVGELFLLFSLYSLVSSPFYILFINFYYYYFGVLGEILHTMGHG